MRRLHRAVAMPVVILLAATGYGAAAAGATANPAGPAKPVASAPLDALRATAEPVTVTLITGDKVRVTDRGKGAPSVAFIPAPGSKLTRALTRTIDDRLYVIPEKALPLLADQRLDKRLFDVALLAEQARRRGSSDLSVLVTASSSPLRPSVTLPPSTTRKEPPAPPKAPKFSKRTHTLESVGASAVRISSDDAVSFWTAQTGQAPASSRPATAIDKGIGSIWLDAPVKALLDKSVPQLGADQLWKRSSPLTGRGVKVAVLDTGIDDQHVDVKGQVVESKSFVAGQEDDVDDPYGHGTHVASILAGTGLASAGRDPAPFVGVAPDAGLLDGRVLDEDGFGDDSWVIAGMEWAADQGADIVSMSLGGMATDGTDPVSAAVDRLTAEKDVLFVIAAGNDGAPRSVGSPGSAASALTVGAIDRDGALADFSSQGPVVGGAGIKPEITAPGVEIVAAAAAGSLIEQEVGETEPGYLAISGTSMATPHVSGVAALIAQEYPDASPAELKARLVNGAVPAETEPGQPRSVWAQGGGRVDAPRALTQVTTAQSTLNLGFLRWPHVDEKPVARELTYRNHGSEPVTLQLSASAKNDDGDLAADGGFTLSASSLAVPAKGTATVTLTGTPDALDVGNWSGTVTATVSGAGEPLARTPFGLIKETEHYDVKVQLVGTTGGAPEAGDALLINADTGEQAFGPNWGICEPCDEPVVLRVPPGRWFASGSSLEEDAFAALLAQPIDITEDTTVTLDARKSVPVSFAGPDKQAENLLTWLGWDYVIDDESVYSSTYAGLGASLRATPVAFDGLRSTSGATDRRPTVVATTSATAGATLDASVWWEFDERWEGKHTGRLVESDLSGSERELHAQLNGRWVVTSLSTQTAGDDLIAKAAKAGAKAIVLIQPEEFPEDADLDGVFPVRKPVIPALGFSQDDAEKVVAAARAGASMTVNGRQLAEPRYLFSVDAEGEIPARLSRSYTASQLHTRTETVRALGKRDLASLYRFPDSPVGGWAIVQGAPTPFTRTDYLTPGGWTGEVELGSYVSDDGEFIDQPGAWSGASVTVKAGETSYDTWATGPLHASALNGRIGDLFWFFVPAWTDASRHLGSAWGMAGRWTLASGGKVIAEDEGAWGEVELPAGKRTFTLSYSGTIEGFGSVERSRSVSAVWTFPSQHVDEDEDGAEQPLLSLDLDLPLDEFNRAKAGSTTSTAVTATAAGKPVRLTSLSYEFSTNGGKSWQKASVKRSADGFTATVKHPGKKKGPGNQGLVDLRITAKAAGGLSVTETIGQAYGLK